jgi:hypothetical protein
MTQSVPIYNNNRGGNRRRGKKRNNKSNRGRGVKNEINGDNAGTDSVQSMNNISGNRGRRVINHGGRRNRGARHLHQNNRGGNIAMSDDFDYNILPRPKAFSPDTHRLNYPGITGVEHIPPQLVNETFRPLPIPRSADPPHPPGSDH